MKLYFYLFNEENEFNLETTEYYCVDVKNNTINVKDGGYFELFYINFFNKSLNSIYLFSKITKRQKRILEKHFNIRYKRKMCLMEKMIEKCKPEK